MELLSEQHCSGSYFDRQGCQWYHGAWKQLKALGLVSQPEWHKEFFLGRLIPIFRSGGTSVLVCGAADEAMLSLTLEAASLTEISVTAVFLELCRTPLLYSKQVISPEVNQVVPLVQADALTLPFNKSVFDAITTDAFLTRFSRVEARRVVQEWRRTLKPGGTVITTVRLGSESSNPTTPNLLEKADYLRRVLFRSLQFGQPLTSVVKKAWQFLGRTNSRPMSEQSIFAVFEGFSVHIEESEMIAEIGKRRYARVTATVDD